jgi:hypothetical protein
LYLGYYNPTGDERGTVRLAGDGKISWTAIEDLGLGNALIPAAPTEEWAGKTFYLSTPPETAKSLKEVAALVSDRRRKNVVVDIVGRQEHNKQYIHDRKMDAPAVEWWSHTHVLGVAERVCVVGRSISYNERVCECTAAGAGVVRGR